MPSSLRVKAAPHAGGVFFREMANEREARGALNQHADGGLVPRTEDQITLVVAGNQASFRFGWTADRSVPYFF